MNIYKEEFGVELVPEEKIKILCVCEKVFTQDLFKDGGINSLRCPDCGDEYVVGNENGRPTVGRSLTKAFVYLDSDGDIDLGLRLQYISEQDKWFSYVAPAENQTKKGGRTNNKRGR